MYVSLTQSNADEDKLVASINTDLYPTGTQDVDGVKWVVYEGGGQDGKPAEPVWTTRLNGAGRAGADRDNRRRRYGRVPYAGGGDADPVATAREVGTAILAIPDGDAMTAPEADLTGWTVAPFSAAGYTHDVLPQGRGPRRGADPGAARHTPRRAGVWVITWWTTDSPWPARRCSASRGAGIKAGRMVPIMLRGCVAREFAAICDERGPTGRALPARAGARPQREDAGQGRRRDRPVLHRRLRTWRPRSTTACWRPC